MSITADTQRDNLRTVQKWLNERTQSVPHREIAELCAASNLAAFCTHCREKDCQISLDGLCNMTRFYLTQKQKAIHAKKHL
jgi:hypothetical protein